MAELEEFTPSGSGRIKDSSVTDPYINLSGNTPTMASDIWHRTGSAVRFGNIPGGYQAFLFPES
jgi:hypothetical protein